MSHILGCALSLNSYRPLDLSLTQMKPKVANVFTVGAPPPWDYNIAPTTADRISSPVVSSIEEDLKPISELEDGWHGAGSVHVAKDVLGRVRELGRRIGAVKGLGAPEVTPTVHGTISLEWENEATSIYIEIGKTRINGFIKISGSEPLLLGNFNELPDEILQGLSTLLLPSKGSSYSLSEAYAR